MATMPNKNFALTIRTAAGEQGIVLCVDDHGPKLVDFINEYSDAQATAHGLVRETPMVNRMAPRDGQDIAETQLRQDFERVMIGRELVALRGLTYAEDTQGGYWSATALWVFINEKKEA